MKANTYKKRFRPKLEPLYFVIGRRIRSLRKQQSLTLFYIGKCAGLTPTCIANIEAGAQRVTVHALLEIAKALETTICDLTAE